MALCKPSFSDVLLLRIFLCCVCSRRLSLNAWWCPILTSISSKMQVSWSLLPKLILLGICVTVLYDWRRMRGLTRWSTLTIIIRVMLVIVMVVLCLSSSYNVLSNIRFYCAVLCVAEILQLCGVRSSVCLSVTFAYSVETNNHIFKKISLSCSHTILIFPYQAVWQYSDWDP